MKAKSAVFPQQKYTMFLQRAIKATAVINKHKSEIYEGVFKSFRTGHLERELQMV
jgi:hypothetical protein